MPLTAPVADQSSCELAAAAALVDPRGRHMAKDFGELVLVLGDAASRDALAAALCESFVKGVQKWI